MGFLLDFLFGKSAKIFNKKGRVEHDLGQKKWQEWDSRLQGHPDYDWRQHKGKKPLQSKKNDKH